MARLTARGKYLYEGERKFVAKGVSYGPFAPNSRGERYPEPEQAARDFALIQAMGANLLRVYVPPPAWLFEAAAKHELRLLVGIPWPFHMAFLDSRRMTGDVRRTIRTGVAEMRRFGETIFAYSLGNEVRSDIVRWHGPAAVSSFLDDLYDIGKALDPDGLFTYANYPSTEYLDLSFLDLICFNVYLHRESDFYRYMTHLMAASRDRPLVLSETGMDTIREGEAHQAQLLSWQARAALRLGLSGFIVFAFTDAWHTGGAEITDWAFGLVGRDRTPKLAYGAVGEVFRAPMPPALEAAPKVSIVVAAYQAAQTLPACLESLRRLNYPDYETIVVDDGSTDNTAALAREAGVKLLQQEHRGLACARNAGVDAATGEIIAFIDADAQADIDWLYHLVETLCRRGCAAAGGSNFPPAAGRPMELALCAAPGAPREVRADADNLSQLCGCNMAITKSALETIGGFDPLFTAAGDDVDISWRLADRGYPIAYAPGAVVIHRRRSSIGGYLAQQLGYGAAEAALERKYPGRPPDSIYGGGLLSWIGRARVYHGSFGRGLFQTVYPSGYEAWVAEGALNPAWVIASAAALVLGAVSRTLFWFGVAGLLTTLFFALFGAATAPLPEGKGRLRARIYLAWLCLVGPLGRGWARMQNRRVRPVLERPSPMRLHLGGELDFAPDSDSPDDLPPLQTFSEGLAAALVERMATVKRASGYESHDLQVLIWPAVRVPINLIARGATVHVRWRLRPIAAPLYYLAGIFVLLLILGLSWALAIGATIVAFLFAAVLMMPAAGRMQPLIEQAAEHVAARWRLRPLHAGASR